MKTQPPASEQDVSKLENLRLRNRNNEESEQNGPRRQGEEKTGNDSYRLQDPQMPQVSPQEGRESRSNWAR